MGNIKIKIYPIRFSMLIILKISPNILLSNQISIRDIIGKTSAPVFHNLTPTWYFFVIKTDNIIKESRVTIKNNILDKTSDLVGAVHQSPNPNIKRKEPSKRKTLKIKLIVKTPRNLPLFGSFITRR